MHLFDLKANCGKNSKSWNLCFTIILVCIFAFNNVMNYCKQSNMWPNTTEGTSCLFLRKLGYLHLTEDLTSSSMIQHLLTLMWYFWNYNFYKVWISFIFSLNFTHYFVHYLRINLAELRCPFCCTGSHIIMFKQYCSKPCTMRANAASHLRVFLMWVKIHQNFLAKHFPTSPVIPWISFYVENNAALFYFIILFIYSNIRFSNSGTR